MNAAAKPHNLRQWIKLHLRTPLLLASLCIFCLQMACIGFWMYKDGERQDRIVAHLVQFTALAITQHNRPLVEAMVDVASNDLSAHALILCQKQQVIISYPRGYRVCHATQASVLRRVISISPPGRHDYRLTVILPRFPHLGVFSLILVLTVVFSLWGLALIARIRRRIETDIVMPLTVGLDGSAQLPISELDAIRKVYHHHHQIAAQQSALNAMTFTVDLLSHDIRRPFAQLCMWVEELERSEDCQLARASKNIRQSLGAIDGMIDDLRNLSCNDHLNLQATSLANCMDASIAEVDVTMPCATTLCATTLCATTLCATTLCPPTLCVRNQISSDIVIHCDGKRLQRAFANIIDNAVNACRRVTYATHIQITATALGDGADRSIRICFENNGPSIPDAEMEHLFDCAFTKNTTGGRGIGLASVKTIVSRHDGNVAVVNNSDRGVTVIVELPVSPVISKDSAASVVAIPARADIFYCDDSSLMQRVIRAQIQSLNRQHHCQYQLHTFDTGEALLRGCKARRPDVVISDIDMSEAQGALSGFDVVAHVKANDPTVRTILLSSQPALTHEQRGQSDVFLPLPCHADDLFVALQ